MLPKSLVSSYDDLKIIFITQYLGERQLLYMSDAWMMYANRRMSPWRATIVALIKIYPTLTRSSLTLKYSGLS